MPAILDTAQAEKAGTTDLSIRKSSTAASPAKRPIIPLSQDAEKLIGDDWAHSPRNPLNWSKGRKWTLIMVIGITNLVASMTTAFAPALPQMMRDFHSSNDALASLTVSAYVIGYFLGPIVFAPMSEVYGRVSLLWPGYLTYLVCLAICGSATNIAVFIAFRIVMGVAGIALSLLGIAVVADLTRREELGFVYNAMSAANIFGPALGPVIGGYMVEKVSWRWIFWACLIAMAALAAAALAIFRETYSPILLAQERLQDASTPSKPPSLPPGSPSSSSVFLHGPWLRPVRMLFQCPIVTLCALYSVVFNGYLFMLLATIGTVFQDVYGFTPGESGLAYLGMALGFLVAPITLAYFSDRHVAKMNAKRGVHEPEYRLPPLIVGAVMVPVAFFWYGWSIERKLHWIMPVLASAVGALGIMYTSLPVNMYLVDAYTTYSASASGACIILRSICGGLLPLAVNPLYDRLGYGWGNSLLGFIALAFIPLTVLLLRYSKRIRTDPRFQPEL